MVVESFTVTPVSSAAIYLIFIGPVVILVAAVARYMTNKSKTGLLAMVVVSLVIFAGTYVFIQYRVSQPGTVTIGNGYIDLSSSQTGNLNFSSGQISNAYVAQIGSGNQTLTRVHGLYNGVDRFGVYRTGNGHTAYVISSVPRDLFIQLTSGDYVVVGNSNLTAMVSLFNQEVYPG